MDKQRMSNDNSNSFYYVAGIVAGKRFPDVPRSFRVYFVDGFKRFIESRGGLECFKTPTNAVNQYCYEQSKRGGKRHAR